MKNKTIKIITMVFTIGIVLMTLTAPAFALDTDIDPSQVTANTDAIDATKVQDIGGKILGGIQVASAVLATLIIAVLGVKYMMGSAEEKADYKKSFVPYIIGALLIFAAPQIAGMIFSILG